MLYLLVVFNVLYLGWNLSTGGVAGGPGEQPVASVPDGARTLVLLEESRKGDFPGRGASKADERFTEEVSTAGDGAKKVSDVNSGQVRDRADDDLLARVEFTPVRSASTCKAIGPFNELAEAIHTVLQLNGMGIEPVVYALESRVVSDYWVYLPGKGKNQSRKTARLLRDNKIVDFYVYNDSDYLVSLGIFKTAERAGKRQAEVQELGLDAVLEKRYETKVAHWLDFPYTGQNDDQFKALVSGTDGLQMVASTCMKFAAK
jgi:hypothetical protein